MVLCFSAAAAGSFYTNPALSSWYAGLEKPFFNPPNWVFGPVWTVLYFLMGISFYLIWISKNSRGKSFALRIFLLQLFLNFLWSYVFFGLQNPQLAFLVIITLLASIGFTIKLFYKNVRKAAYLLVPYFLWVSFASILNLFVAVLN